VDIPQKRWLPRNQAYFATHIRELEGLDLLHSPVSVAPLILFRRIPRLVTVQDVAFKINPEIVPRLILLWQNTAWPICLRKATHIATTSAATASDLGKYFGTPTDKITVIPCYVSLAAPSFREDERQARRKALDLPSAYILHVGVPHKRKNISGLIRAFQILKATTRIPHKLLLVGPQGWDRKQLESDIQERGLGAEVTFLGYVPDTDLAIVYALADVFVFPSFYEGFGYPPLEAMACGTPTVVADTSSLPEVAGDAALYVDPKSSEDIASKIRSVLTDSVLAATLRERGRLRIRSFSVENMIKSYLELYKQIGSRRG